MNARRHIWLLAAALTALLAGSCAKIQGPDEDGEWNPLKGDVPVAFSSSLSAPATKATLPLSTHFGVFAYYTKTRNWASAKNTAKPDFMYNEDVLYSGGSTYTYSPIKYWPNNANEKVTFWAYCPYSASPALLKPGTNNLYDNTSSNIPDVRFTVTDGLTDFMISDIAADQTKPSVNTPVTLTFNHALSRISFYVKKVDAAVPEKYTVKLKNIRFDSIYLTATHRSSGWTDWTLPRRNISVFAPADASGYTTLSTSYPDAVDPSAAPNAVSIVLPQALNYEFAMLHVEYTIDFEGLLNTRTMVSNIPLRSVFESASSLWAEGKEYKVYISITPDDPIEFSVIWSNWGQVHNNHISS